jgi:RNA polymerase sigma factor (sigma-70 family)
MMVTCNGVSTNPQLLSDIAKPDNNEAAWRTFLARYQPLIQKWCLSKRLNQDQAEEVSARVLAKLVTAMRTKFTYDPKRRFRAWLLTLVNNEIVNVYRENHRQPGAGSGDPAVHWRLDQVPAPADAEGLVNELDTALERDLYLSKQVTELVQARVQETTWMAFWQTGIAGEPAGEVAQRLGMTVAAVYMAKSRVSRLLQEEGAKVRDQGSLQEEGAA